jgi:hypothetical protein
VINVTPEIRLNMVRVPAVSPLPKPAKIVVGPGRALRVEPIENPLRRW